MTCNDAEMALLKREESSELSAHLASCAACRAFGEVDTTMRAATQSDIENVDFGTLERKMHAMLSRDRRGLIVGLCLVLLYAPVVGLLMRSWLVGAAMLAFGVLAMASGWHSTRLRRYALTESAWSQGALVEALRAQLSAEIKNTRYALLSLPVSFAWMTFSAFGSSGPAHWVKLSLSVVLGLSTVRVWQRYRQLIAERDELTA